MTPFVANALAERLADVGLLAVVNGQRDKYVVAGFDWASDVIEESQIDQTVKLFARWAGPKLEPTGRKISDQALEDAILLRLAMPEFASIFMDDDAKKKNARLKGLLGFGGVDPKAKDDAYLDYLVAEFVLTTAENAPQVFETISRIAYGALVADAVAGLAVPGAPTMPDPPLRVVFDGPLLLDLLDLNTVEHRSYAEGLLEIIKSAGLRIAVFDHSVEEMRETIRSTVQAYQRNAGFGPMAERFRTSSGHVLYATTVADSLQTKILELGFVVLPSQIYEEARYKKYFPEARVDHVRNAIGDLHEHVEARIRDAKSVATVARLKGEKKSAESILHAGTIFVTRNSVLARRVIRALSNGHQDPDPRFTIATDGQLAGVLWFVSGITGVELSRKRLIANCSSAILPKPEVISRIANLLTGLNPQLSEEFSALMSDRRASLCPMRITVGIADSITEETSLQILHAMKGELAAPALARAIAAEARVAAQEAELERTTAEGKGAVLVLQSAVETQEEKRFEDRRKFDEQLAQLGFDLMSAENALQTVRQEELARGEEIARRISDAVGKLSWRERRMQRVFHSLFSVIGVSVSLVSILLPEFGGLVFKAILAVVFLASVPWVNSIFDSWSKRIVARMYVSERRYISGLRDAAGNRGVLLEHVAPANN
jgi:hypothetical protein